MIRGAWAGSALASSPTYSVRSLACSSDVFAPVVAASAADIGSARRPPPVIPFEMNISLSRGVVSGITLSLKGFLRLLWCRQRRWGLARGEWANSCSFSKQPLFSGDFAGFALENSYRSSPASSLDRAGLLSKIDLPKERSAPRRSSRRSVYPLDTAKAQTAQ